jgi:hypothetical protein
VVSESLPSRLPSGVQDASKKTIDIYDGAGLYERSSEPFYLCKHPSGVQNASRKLIGISDDAGFYGTS